jgi:FAD/FMN-containing dehydrogenase
MTKNLPIDGLRADIQGAVLAVNDDGYDEARRVFYPGYDYSPVAVVRAAGAEDVIHAVNFARQAGLELAVRSGAHSLAGHGVSQGGLVIDLSMMKALDIDSDKQTAWAQTGLTGGEYTRIAAEHGLATGFGDTASVGIGGLTLGGGIGYMVRQYGLTIDNLLAAEIVTADGQLRRVDAENEPDLFWAIRGGGGNFGVVTRFQFRLHPVDHIVGGMLILPATPEVIYGFIQAAEAAPEELSTIANIMQAPPMSFLPEAAHGKMILMGMLAYKGDEAAGQRALAPFRALAEPLADMVAPTRYMDLFPDEEEQEFPTAADITRTVYLDGFGLSDAQTVVDFLEASSAPMRVAQLRVLGGAMARIASDATAYAHRDRPYMAAVAALYDDLNDTDQHEAWVTSFVEALPTGRPGAYVNFLGNEGQDRVRAAYPGGHWERLRVIKARFDPDNLFRLNQNIPPAERVPNT